MKNLKEIISQQDTVTPCVLNPLCKRLRDSILSPIFHSYIFAMYKNESLWI